MMVLRVLGPLEAEIAGQAAELGSRLQRAVLARLLAERGHAVSVDRMIDQLWRGEAPPRAIASLQSYISNLRRLLEPDRPQRSPATILISAPPGYAIRLPAEAVDAWHFERLLGAARNAAGQDPRAARRCLEEGLALFRGEAYAEFADEEWASPEAIRLGELRVQARELWAQVALRTGPPEPVVPAAAALTREYPLREEGWRMLALAQWGAGRQGDALAALRRARQVLGEELGIDPGPALTGLEEAILRQRLDVLRSALGAPSPPGLPGGDGGRAGPGDGGSRGDGGELSVEPGRQQPPRGSPGEPLDDRAEEPFVGREAELASVRAAAAAAVARGPGGVVLITGEAGLGKSALLARARDQLTADGWLAMTGSCPETEGAPPAWAWVQALRELARHLPAEQVSATVAVQVGDYSRLARHPGARAGAEPDGGQRAQDAPEARVGDTAAGRFRLHRAVAAWLRAAASRQPVAVFLDDLHNADTETRALLETLAAELAGSPVLLVAAYRPADADGRLDDLLAALARRAPLRLNLPGLPPPDVAALVRAVHSGPVDEPTLRALAERTGGNPFYVRETARLLASEGALAAAEEVPEGVRDVLRKRLARLPAQAVAVLRLAAVAGREADVDVLVAAADTDEDAVLDGLEAGVLSGLLTEPSPGRVRFEHVLVRDTLYGDLTRLRRVRMHSRLAEALRALRPGDLDALVYHYGSSVSPGTARLVIEYAIRAAELAARRYAHDTEVALLQQAVDAFGLIAGHGIASHGGDIDQAGQEVGLLGRLLGAQLRAGRVPDARRTRQHAVAIAEHAGRPDLAAAAFAAWTEPTPWQARSYGEVDLAAIGSLTRLLDGADLPPAVRCRLLATLVDELAGEDDPRPAEAAAESLRIARELGEPDLIALALAASGKAVHPEREAQARLRYAAELLGIAQAHAMPAYEWYAEYFSASVSATQGEVRELRATVRRLQVIAKRYRMAEPQAVTRYAEGFLAHVDGRFADAEAHYARGTALLARNDPQHAMGVQLLALLTVRLSEGRAGELLGSFRDMYAQLGQVAADPYAAVLVAAGRLDEVPAVRLGLPPLRPDFFYSLYATFRAMAVVALGEPGEAESLLAGLLPLREQLAGANTVAMAARPVAHTLGELCQVLGRRQEAERHFAHAEAVALRWGARHWATAARSALEAVPDRGNRVGGGG